MIGSAIDSECTTDRAGVGESAAPLTGVNRVTRHAPLRPPLKIVNMGIWKRGTAMGSSPLSFRGARSANPESRDPGFDATHRPGMTGPVNNRENPNNLRI